MATGAFYSDSESQAVILGKSGDSRAAGDFTQESTPTFLLKDFFTGQYLRYRPLSTLSTTRTELKTFLQTWKSEAPAVTTEGNTDSDYVSDFGSLKRSWSETLKKVVLVSREQYRSPDHLATRRNLLKRAFEFEQGIPYGIWNDDYGVIGCSPELLFSLRGQELRSIALAGTSRKGNEKVLLNSVKDRQEHDLVIRDILEKLRPHARFLKHSETRIFSFKDLIHLRTEIEALLNDNVSLNQLVGSLSPTAALGGYPQEESLQFLKTTSYYQNHPKRFFGSAFGVTSTELNQFLVSIRNVQWDQDRFYIESGGGVLPSSTLESELAEIHLKRNTIRKHYL